LSFSLSSELSCWERWPSTWYEHNFLLPPRLTCVLPLTFHLQVKQYRNGTLYNKLPVFKFGNTKRENEKFKELMDMNPDELDDGEL
jgi:hypothetical protein